MTRPVAKLVQGRTDWYRISNESTTAELYIYDEIGYWGVTASDLIADLQKLDGKDLTVHVNSPGGEVFDGLAIYQALKSYGGDVTVIVDALAASAASFIAQAGDKVIMAPKATMMIHDGHSLAIGNAKDLRDTADLLDKASDNIASIYADRSGQPLEFWRDQMKAETWYTAQEAVDAGLADEVQGSPKAATNRFDLSVFAYAGRDKAPEPVLKSEAVPNAVKPVEEPEFEFDFASFSNALKEGISG
jgi:ATP-dependent Clp endopeptidase proteolytic subunit ClpP